jgi:hypothetical protein
MGYWWIVHYFCSDDPNSTSTEIFHLEEIAEPNDTCPTQFPICPIHWIAKDYAEEAIILGPGMTPVRPGPTICGDCEYRREQDELQLQEMRRRRHEAMRADYPRRHGASASFRRRVQKTNEPQVSLLNEPAPQHHDEFHRIMEVEGQEKAEEYWRMHGWETG